MGVYPMHFYQAPFFSHVSHYHSSSITSEETWALIQRERGGGSETKLRVKVITS